MDCPVFITLSYIFKTFLGLNPGSLNLSYDMQVKTNTAIIYTCMYILYISIYAVYSCVRKQATEM